MSYTHIENVGKCNDDCLECLAIGMSRKDAKECKDSNVTNGFWQCIKCGAHAENKRDIKHYNGCEEIN